MPVRGKLEFRSRRADFEGTNVGREFEYRRYIPGHPEAHHRAVWNFTSIPSGSGLDARDRVPVEFTFDVYRMTKCKTRGVRVSFRVVTHQRPNSRPVPIRGRVAVGRLSEGKGEQQYRDAVKELQDKYGINPDSVRPSDKEAWAKVNELAEKFGIFDIRDKEVFDYAVMGVEVPAGLFRNALQGNPGKFRPKDGIEKPCRASPST